MSIAFLGPRGTFSEEAATLYGGDAAEFVAVSSIPALTSAVETGIAEVAVLPIENSIEGPVSTTLDLLIYETGLRICAEVVVPVRHQLVAPEGATLQGITTVLSHPQALGQTRRFRERFLPNAGQVAALSTAGAIEEVVKQGDPTKAAIGPARAHALYGGVVLAHDIQDIRANFTRFVVLRADDAEPTGDDKTSIGIIVKANLPGALERVIRPFATQGLQLTKIESRPLKGKLWEYVFLIDFEGHRDDEKVQWVLKDLEEPAAVMKVFGSFPRYPAERYADLLESPALV
ncbi:MAG: prephenate dehydratase [Thermomicrobiales bacterium]